ncbi:MAG: radical SAM family heme chaperone HemW [Buchnera aphidicola (Schlechtendalia peitan)]
MLHFPPLSLYIHIPWCTKICPYCDFNISKHNSYINEKIYIKHLLKDLERNYLYASNRKINSIFIGGGTPSLFSPVSISYLLNKIKEIANISHSPEITLELNPTISEISKLIDYQESGINRFSIGIQTFNSHELNLLERNYNSQELNRSIKILNTFNLNNINFDLMYGLPNQTLHSALLNLKIAIKLQPKHISWYQLSIEPETNFYFKKMKLPNIDLIWNMFSKGKKILKKSGYQHYEISSYSKKKYNCLHNLNYWRFGDYIGIGCGAHGKLTNKNGNITRTIKKNYPNYYLNKSYVYKQYILSKHDIVYEFFMNYFRLYEPISKNTFKKYTNISEHKIFKTIKIAISKKYLIETKKYWITTKKGKLFLHSLLDLFLKSKNMKFT